MNNSESLVFPDELLTKGSILFYRYDVESESMLYMTPNAPKVLGFEGKEFQQDENLWLNRIHPGDRDELLAAWRSAMDSGSAEIEFRFRHSRGHYIWLQSEMASTDGLLAGSLIEVTDCKETQKKLKESSRELNSTSRKLNKLKKKLRQQNQTLKLQELAINNINDMVLVTKAPKNHPEKAEVIFVNKTFEQFTGYKSEEILGCQPNFLHGSETSEEVLQRISRNIRNHQSLREEFINYTKDGKAYWVELDMSPFLTEEGDFEYWVGINRDISQRKQAEQKIEENGKRYRAIAELSFDAIFEMDLAGTIINCNKRACELFGFDRDELIGMDSLTLIPEKYRKTQPESFTKFTTTGDEAWERTYKAKDGTLIPTEIHTQMYNIGRQKRLIAYVRDNTAHKEYENKIQQSLKEKETLLAEIHHRVKNNLAIISGLLEMQAFNTRDEKLLEKLKESRARIQSIAMVHEKLYSSDSFSEIVIDQYIDDLLEMIVGSIVKEKKICIEKHLETVSLTVGQAIPCGLLLNELITNSCKHAFSSQEKQGVIKIILKKIGERIILKVEDDGVGLPEDFDIQKENSLGMTLINTLVKQLKGDLKVETTAGTTFTITFEVSR